MARCQPASSEHSSSQPTVSADNVTQRRFIPFGVVAALVIAAVIGAYSNTFANGFHLDDEYGLIQNPWIRSLANVPHFFADPFTLTTLARNADYRPVLQATYALNYSISQYKPWSWHVMNLFLHVIVVLGVYTLGRTLFGRGRIVDTPGLKEEDGDWPSLAAAVLFAVHPITTGIANYMWARSSLLVAAFILPASILYIRAIRDRRGFSALLLPLTLYGLALFTKVEAISFIGVLYVAELLMARSEPAPRQERRRKERVEKGAARSTSLPRRLLIGPESWRRFAPLAAISAVYFMIRLAVIPPGMNDAWGVYAIDRTTYFLTQFRAWWYYIGQILAPVQMVADYGAYPESHSLLDPRVLYALAGWGVVGLLLFYSAGKAPAIAFLGFAYFTYLSPTSSFMPLSEMVNEHRPYLPDAGLFLLAMVGLFLLVSRMTARPRAIFALVVTVVAIPLIGITRERNRVWQDEMTLWADTVAKNPESPRAQMNYGVELMKVGKMSDAESRFRETVRLAPQYNFARINLAIALAHRGDIQGARHEYDEAVRLEPNDTNSYYWRGLFLAEQGDLAGSVADLQAAVAHSIVPARELKALAETLVRAGRMQEARQAVERGSALDPNLFGELRAKVGVQG